MSRRARATAAAHGTGQGKLFHLAYELATFRGRNAFSDEERRAIDKAAAEMYRLVAWTEPDSEKRHEAYARAAWCFFTAGFVGEALVSARDALACPAPHAHPVGVARLQYLIDHQGERDPFAPGAIP